MKTNLFIAFIFFITAKSYNAYSSTVICSDKNYKLEVEMKYLERDKAGKTYFNRQYRPFPEDWSLAYPGLGLIRIQTKDQMPYPQKVKLEYRSKSGEVLEVKEMKLDESMQEGKKFFVTKDDLDLELKNFFKKALQGKVQISVIENSTSHCSRTLSILGILDQQD